ncbi:MAG: hypothetical protein IJ191_09700 [Treponema sp.]|nr:hypothetical protein [Treponema sp.]
MKYSPLIPVLLTAALAVSGCKKKNDVLPVTDMPATAWESDALLYTWYYFDATGMHLTTSPHRVPLTAKRPWTEAIRISAAGTAADTGISAPPAYAVVNRSGIIEFTERQATLYPDVSLFSETTASNLVFVNGTPFFSLYTNTFFNRRTDITATHYHPFLAQFSPVTHISTPVLAIENLGLPADANVTDFVWDGTVWLCEIKTETAERTTFSYRSWQPTGALAALTPAHAARALFMQESTQAAFRAVKSPVPFATAPARLIDLLQSVPPSIPFFITCATAGGVSPRTYVQHLPDARYEETEAVPLSAQACIAETWACAVFQDGTVYLSGALYDRPIINNGAPIAFKLPPLPAGCVYGDFAICGATMYVAWEERSFYETGKSGFLAVALDKLISSGV